MFGHIWSIFESKIGLVLWGLFIMFCWAGQSQHSEALDELRSSCRCLKHFERDVSPGRPGETGMSEENRRKRLMCFDVF